ncbi:MAG: hypothetical protein ACREVL_08425 [Solimonas sp.]
METLDTRQAQAIVRLSSDSDFHVFCEWLRASLGKADADNRALEGARLHRSQGVAMTLDEILGAPERARKALARSRA